uniref:Uncharacterized protein n=1 Tax=Mola mola TaxID=94237 RepID=A0A3Q3VRH3_MOLML
MAEDNELEKRAIEELLKETDRARTRAETMGPTGWLKCPLRSTNKRFLLNTLRSTGLQRRPGDAGDAHSTATGGVRSDSPDRNRERSRTPPRDHRSHRDRKHHHRDNSCHRTDKKREREGERSHRHSYSRERRHGRDSHSRDK